MVSAASSGGSDLLDQAIEECRLHNLRLRGVLTVDRRPVVLRLPPRQPLRGAAGRGPRLHSGCRLLGGSGAILDSLCGRSAREISARRGLGEHGDEALPEGGRRRQHVARYVRRADLLHEPRGDAGLLHCRCSNRILKEPQVLVGRGPSRRRLSRVSQHSPCGAQLLPLVVLDNRGHLTLVLFLFPLLRGGSIRSSNAGCQHIQAPQLVVRCPTEHSPSSLHIRGGRREGSIEKLPTLGEHGHGLLAEGCLCASCGSEVQSPNPQLAAGRTKSQQPQRTAGAAARGRGNTHDATALAGELRGEVDARDDGQPGQVPTKHLLMGPRCRAHGAQQQEAATGHGAVQLGDAVRGLAGGQGPQLGGRVVLPEHREAVEAQRECRTIAAEAAAQDGAASPTAQCHTLPAARAAGSGDGLLVLLAIICVRGMRFGDGARNEQVPALECAVQGGCHEGMLPARVSNGDRDLRLVGVVRDAV
mmetsp:Transcript_92662/g.235612  ORF Transcript_92662/g.235612 Transcript_92662/m.235612 type:complete len:474 (+) Transcript_92662:149-1570(+)